jgi:uncharacterized protein YifN (PemK superfamily)
MSTADVVAVLQMQTQTQAQVQMPMSTVDMVVVQPLPILVQAQVPVPMSTADVVVVLQMQTLIQVQVQAPMFTVEDLPQQIQTHHQVLQLTLIGLMINQTTQMMTQTLDILQDVVIHAIVTVIGFVFASAD